MHVVKNELIEDTNKKENNVVNSGFEGFESYEWEYIPFTEIVAIHLFVQTVVKKEVIENTDNKILIFKALKFMALLNDVW